MTVTRGSPFGVLFIYQDRTTQADIKDVYTGIVIIVARVLESRPAALGERGCGSALTDSSFEKSSLTKDLGIGDVYRYLGPSLYNFQPQWVRGVFRVNLCPDAREVRHGRT